MNIKSFVISLFPKVIRNKLTKILDKNHLIVYYWKSKLNNFGDELNVFLLNKISHKDIKHISEKKIHNSKSVISFIGSILKPNFKLNRKLVIMGSGFIEVPKKINYDFKKIYFVRGPLTREILINNQIECPDLYCDPGLLLPFFYKKKVISKKYDLGIIPHYKDKSTSNFINLLFKVSDNVNIIDIQGPIEQVISEINSCTHIVSSSLHGLITADAYRIPSLWIEFSENVKGKGFKFNDYYRSLGYKISKPIKISEETRIDELIELTTLKNINNIRYKEIFKAISLAFNENNF